MTKLRICNFEIDPDERGNWTLEAGALRLIVAQSSDGSYSAEIGAVQCDDTELAFLWISKKITTPKKAAALLTDAAFNIIGDMANAIGYTCE